jgi:hypothetical protein
MQLHITVHATAYPDAPSLYTYNCQVHDEDNSLKNLEHVYPHNTFHQLVSLELGELDEGLYVTALATYLNTYFKSIPPTEKDIPWIHNAIKKQLTRHFTVIPLHTISEEEGDAFDAACNAKLEEVQKKESNDFDTAHEKQIQEAREQIAAFFKTSLPETLNQIYQDFARPSTQATTAVTRHYQKQRLEQPTFIPKLHHHTLFTISRTDIDAFLRRLDDVAFKSSSYLALAQFRDHEPQITPIQLMLFLGNALSALAYPEYNKEPRTPEESVMACQQALRNLDLMLASPYLTNPDLTAFVSTVKHHIQGLKLAFHTQANQELEQTQNLGFGSSC